MGTDTRTRKESATKSTRNNGDNVVINQNSFQEKKGKKATRTTWTAMRSSSSNSSSNNNNGLGSLSLYEDLPEPNYDHLDASFVAQEQQQVGRDQLGQGSNEGQQQEYGHDVNHANEGMADSGQNDMGDGLNKGDKAGSTGIHKESPQYILGTLVVRVVAGRDLEVRCKMR